MTTMTAEAPVRNRKPEDTSSGGVFVGMFAPTQSFGVHVLFARDDGTGEKREDPTVALRFSDLADWWHADTDGMSADREKFEHPAYLKILNLGPPVLRYILMDLRDRKGHWYEALRQLTGDANVDADAHGKMTRAREVWLAWGRSKKLI